MDAPGRPCQRFLEFAAIAFARRKAASDGAIALTCKVTKLIIDQRGDHQVVSAIGFVKDLDFEGDQPRCPSYEPGGRCFIDFNFCGGFDGNDVEVIAFKFAAGRALAGEVTFHVSRADAETLVGVVLPSYDQRDIQFAIAVLVLAEHLSRLKFDVSLLGVEDIATGIIVDQSERTGSSRETKQRIVAGGRLQAGKGALSATNRGLSIFSNPYPNVVTLRRAARSARPKGDADIEIEGFSEVAVVSGGL